MVDGMELAKEPAHLGPSVPREIGADTCLQVGRLSHIEDISGCVDEPVDARPVGEPGREAKLPSLGMSEQPGEVEQLFELHYSERAGPFEQRVREVTGGQYIGQGPVRGLMV